MNASRRRWALRLCLAGLWPAAAFAQVQPPQVLLQSIDAVTIEGNDAVLDLTLQVRNTGPLALPLQAVDFSLQLGGAMIGQGRSTTPVSIPAGGRAALPVRLTVNGPTLVQLLLTLPGNDRLPYRIDGTAEIGQTLLRIPFEQDGVVRLPVQ
jgi:LEA14-like dessication related protein